jgi:hypothetical protein
MKPASFLLAAMLATACGAGNAQATGAAAAALRPHLAASDEVPPKPAFAQALASLRQGRTSEAYGRLLRLADGGHADAARVALVMLRHGSALYGTAWTAAPSQVAAWERTVRGDKPLQLEFFGE